MDHGRFAVAEDALEHADFPRVSRAFGLRESLLQELDLIKGQTHEQQHSIRREWLSAKSNWAALLRKHWRVDDARNFAAGTVQSRLDQAGRMAPDDDRVWLGRAYLALRTAQFAESDVWLKKCVERRPEDRPVWRARLEWATTAGRLDEAVEAMHHLDASGLEPGQLLVLRAWLAAQIGDVRKEESAWSRLLTCLPGQSHAVVRLTELAAQAGRTEEVARLRRCKAELDRATDSYRALLDDHVPTERFDELGRLAESLGRWFEARGWWTLFGRDSARDDEARAALARLDRAAQVLALTEGSVSRVLWTGSAHTELPATETTGVALEPHTVAEVLADLIPRDDLHRGRFASGSGLVIPVFRDDASAAGLHFVYDNDPTPQWRLPEAMAGGVGLLDYDGDGWLDVYAVQGGKLSIETPPPPSAMGDCLFRNRGDGTFEDVTIATGLTAFPGGYGHGVAVADYDNDGRPDLFVTRWWSYALYHNQGNGTFEDVTAAAGFSGSRDWPTSAAFADFDGDGDLDLFVCHYADWDPKRSPRCSSPHDPHKSNYCGPRTCLAQPDHIFRNDGGRFVDVSEPAGIRTADRDGRGLGVVATDLDDDGRVDLFVANDLTANFLFRNRGGFRFEETAAEAGVATNAEGGFLAGMGVACGDLDGDGRVDLAVTNYYGESTTFYQNLGAGQFLDRTVGVGLAAPSRYLLGFGAAFIDANNDGRLDLATANGHVNDLRPYQPYVMPAQLLLGDVSGRLTEVSQRAGAPWQVLRLGRGLATGDLDNDGRLDLLIVGEGQSMAYFHNQGPAGHFVTIQLEGSTPGSNRDAIGARVTLTAGGRRQVAHRIGGSSFLSAHDHRLHFGLGEATRVESIEVRWPSGQVQRHTGLAADSAYLLREGQTRALPLHAWRRSLGT